MVSFPTVVVSTADQNVPKLLDGNTRRRVIEISARPSILAGIGTGIIRHVVCTHGEASSPQSSLSCKGNAHSQRRNRHSSNREVIVFN